MKNSVIYLTRRCPRHCLYCTIRDDKTIEKELSITQWIRVFQILQELVVEFNLVLGNEPWLLGEGLPYILKSSKVPYALYTSCSPKLFTKYRNLFFGPGGFTNLSAGVDFPILQNSLYLDDSYTKSLDTWMAFKWMKQYYPKVDLHATITVHKLNFQYLPLVILKLTELGVFSNINFIHWNTDGKFDFFASGEQLSDLLFKSSDFDKLREVLKEVLKSPGLLQNPQMLKLDIATLVEMGWHCKGDPYGGPTIDADGSLRVCGYRKGKHTPKFSIFDLPKKVSEWRYAVKQDALECPGCIWSCPWMYSYWKEKDPIIGSKVFSTHYIPNNE